MNIRGRRSVYNDDMPPDPIPPLSYSRPSEECGTCSKKQLTPRRSPAGYFLRERALLCLLALCLLALLASVGSHTSVLMLAVDRSDDEVRQRAALYSGELDANPSRFVTRYTTWKFFYVAVNLRNNEAILQDFIFALEETMRRVLIPAVGAPERVFVSVFSNGNTDRTPDLIDMYFVAMLNRMGVGYTVHSRGRSCAHWSGATNDIDRLNGYSIRPRNMPRITWLACVRNSALLPLYEHGMHLFQRNNNDTIRVHQSHAAQPPQAQQLVSTPASLAVVREADDVAVLFFNDILFRPRDVADLIATQAGRFDMACGLDFYNVFYDTWVTRDIDGGRFDPYPPFGVVPSTQRAVVAGMETPIKCCWNGLAVIRADLVFLQSPVVAPSPIRFRQGSTHDTCLASECQFFCEDILNSGRSRIILNPRVRVTYEHTYHALQHHSWWYSQRLVTCVWAWLRIWRWPLFYHPRVVAAEGSSNTTQRLQCMRSEEAITIAPRSVISIIASVLLCVLALCCVCCRSGCMQSKKR